MATKTQTSTPATEEKKKPNLWIILLMIFLLFVCFLLGILAGFLGTSMYIGKKLSEQPSVTEEDNDDGDEENDEDESENQYEEELLGRITGSVGYPSEYLPAQNVCAETLEGDLEGCVSTEEGQSEYELEVPPGEYYVYAELKDKNTGTAFDSYRAYYNQFVVCGLEFDCTSHENIVVEVRSDETVDNINPVDWYNGD